MTDIKKAVTAVNNVRKELKQIEEFARENYRQKFADTNPERGWKAFKSVTVINEDWILIKHSFGAGDMEFDDSYTVKIE